MPTLNGVGTKYHGFRNTTPDGVSDVTLWFVLLYFPIIPLRSNRIRCSKGKDGHIYFSILEKIPMNLSSVLTTWFFGWIVTPILWFWPLPFAVREVGEYLGYTTENADGAFYYFVITFAITYIVVFAWKWKDWDEKRGLPVKSK